MRSKDEPEEANFEHGSNTQALARVIVSVAYGFGGSRKCYILYHI